MEIIRPVWIALRAAVLAIIPILIFILIPLPSHFSSGYLIVGIGIVILGVYILAIIPTYWTTLSRFSGNVSQWLRRK